MTDRPTKSDDKPPRCRFSAVARTVFKQDPDRVGSYLGRVRGRRRAVRVKWDDYKLVAHYDESFIEIIET